MKCKCGVNFMYGTELRQHIALQTPRWPAQRCTPEHHDETNVSDVSYLIRKEQDHAEGERHKRIQQRDK